jgi:hypothetical protein
MNYKKISYRLVNLTKYGIITLMLLILNLYSCQSTKQTDNKTTIVGNWFISKNTILKRYYYQEAYFDGKEVYFFTTRPNKILFSNGYSYLGNKLYFLANERKDTVNVFSVIQINEMFSIRSKEGVIEYTKLDDYKTLSQLINGEITKEVFEEAFIERMKKNDANSD